MALTTSQALVLTNMGAGIIGGMLGNAAYTVADNWGMQKYVDKATGALIIIAIGGVFFFPRALGLANQNPYP
jgi:hypothetical protein